jgi:RecA/RadA recombinase
MDFLKDVFKAIDKMDGVLLSSEEPRYWFSSGNCALNKIMTGSFKNCIPQGRITGIFGASFAGKSFSAGNIAREAQKDGASVIYIDTEAAFDDRTARSMGIDVDDKSTFNVVRAATFDKITSVLSTILKSYNNSYGDDKDAPKVLIIIDSISMISTDTEDSKFDKGDQHADRGQHARQAKNMLKPLVNKIADKNISIIFLSHVYPSTDDQIKQGNGVWMVTKSLQYCASQIMLISKLKLKDAKDASNVIGMRMKVEGFKTRFCKPNQTITLEVPYDEPLDYYHGLLPIAQSMGVVKQSGAWQVFGEHKFYGKDLNKYAEEIIAECEKQSDIFLTISEEDARLEVIE